MHCYRWARGPSIDNICPCFLHSLAAHRVVSYLFGPFLYSPASIRIEPHLCTNSSYDKMLRLVLWMRVAFYFRIGTIMQCMHNAHTSVLSTQSPLPAAWSQMHANKIQYILHMHTIAIAMRMLPAKIAQSLPHTHRNSNDAIITTLSSCKRPEFCVYVQQWTRTLSINIL